MSFTAVWGKSQDFIGQAAAFSRIKRFRRLLYLAAAVSAQGLCRYS